LKTHATETDIARLFIALVEYRFMRQCPIKTFRNACTTSLINKKSFMKEVFRKHTKISFRHLETAKKLIKDVGEDHDAIEELKTYLSD